jgi:hypothetical protein
MVVEQNTKNTTVQGFYPKSLMMRCFHSAFVAPSYFAIETSPATISTNPLASCLMTILLGHRFESGTPQ